MDVAAREVGGDAGGFDVPSIPPRVVRTPENPRHALPPPVVGPPRVPGPGSGGVLSGDFAAQPGPRLGRHLLGQRRRRVWVHHRGRRSSAGVIALRKATLLPSVVHGQQTGPVLFLSLRRAVRTPVVRTAVSAPGGGRPGAATGTSLQQDGEALRASASAVATAFLAPHIYAVLFPFPAFLSWRSANADLRRVPR